MKLTRRLASVLIAIFLLAAFPCVGQKYLSESEMQQTFDWFDTLGYPSLTYLAFVKVAGPSQEDDRPIPHFRYGFLMEDKGQAFTVFFPDLTEQTFQKSADGVPVFKRVGYDMVDLSKWGDAGDRTAGFEGLLHNRVQMFVMARACAAQGLAQRALNLCNSSDIMSHSSSAEETKWTFQQRVYEEMAHACMSRVGGDMEDPKVSRETLLTTFQEICRRFPDSKVVPKAKEAVLQLEEMVREDQEHAKLNRKALDQLTGQERAKELIFQLREQNGHQRMNPGRCDIFADPRGEKSPAALLVKMDLVAVPQLIDVLEDQRFTRSVNYPRFYVGTNYVLRIGDAAQSILERIAHRSFESQDRDHAAVKAQILAWWKGYQTQGEQSVLQEAVSHGDRDAATQAQRLVDRYPQAALPAIKEGLKHASEEWVGYDLIQSASRLKGPEVLGLLQDQMLHGASLSLRVNAAYGLREHRSIGTVPPMLEEWKRFSGDGSSSFLDSGQMLSCFLASSGEPRAIQGLDENLKQRPVGVRLNVILSLRGLTYRDPRQPLPENRATQDRVERDAEELLAHELLDTQEKVGYSLDTCAAPRLCDVAAYTLAELWPKRYSFKSDGSIFQRDTKCIRLYNVWLRTNGKPPLPLPARPKIVPVPSGVMAGKLESVRKASSPAEQKTALDVIERMGLPALPAVLQALAKTKPTAPARAGLERLAAHLACTVRTVQAGAALQQLSPEASKELQQLKGKSLTAGQLISMLQSATDQVRDGLTGLDLRVYRDNDGSGFQVTLDVLPGKLDGDTNISPWDFTERVLADPTRSYDTSGGGGSALADDRLIGAIHTALEAPLLQPVLISVQLRRKH